MSRLIFLSVVFAVIAPASIAHALDEPELQLEFLRKLREKGYLNHAEDYLTKLQKTSKDPLLLSSLPLESARLQVAIARSKDPEQRPAYFSQARKDLETFVKAHAGKPSAVQARLELARLLSYQGEAMLSNALREPSDKTAHEKARPAETLFVEAVKELEEAAKSLGELAATFDDPSPERKRIVRQQLMEEHWQARLERASCFINQARTYINIGDPKIGRARSDIIDKVARTAFEEIVLDDKSDPNAQYQAMAWLGKCYIETDAPAKAITFLARVIKEKSKAAQAGQRLANYFYLQWVPEANHPDTLKATALDKIKLVQNLALSWLKMYPGHVKTPEGQGVQYELARAYDRESNALWAKAIETAVGKEKDKDKIKKITEKVVIPKAAVEAMEKAAKYFEAVAQGDSDFAEKANQQSIQIAVQRIGVKTPVEKLTNFNDCFLKAQVEILLLNQAESGGSKLSPAELERKRMAHLRGAIKALRRALVLADSRTPPSKVEDTRYYLTSLYLNAGDLHRAAVMGESLALTRPARRSSVGAGYAIEAYVAILNEDNSEDMRNRLRTLALMVLSDEAQKHWASDPVTGVARYHLAMSYLKEVDAEGTKPYQTVIEELEKLPPTYTGYQFAMGQMVFIALEARDQKGISPEAQKKYTDIAKKTMGRMADLPAEADLATTTMFFQVRMKQAEFLYEDAAEELKKKALPKAAAKFQEMSTFLDGLKARFDKNEERIHKEAHANLAFAFNALKKYATFGLAEVEYRNGNYKKVLSPALAGATLDEVRKLKPDESKKIRIKDFQVASLLLGLALRSQVQLGDIKDAKNTMTLMESLAGEAGDIGAEMSNVLRDLVVDLQDQVRTLKAAKDEKGLKQTVVNFSSFLKDLAERGEKKGLGLRETMFLATCFASLEQHDEAAKLFERVPAPEALKKPAKAKFTPEEEQDLITYWRVQIEYVRVLRKVDKTKANAVVETHLTHPHARVTILAEKEKNHIYEDSGLYGFAIKGWQTFMNNPSLKENLATDRALKELYFEAYFQYGYCVYKYGHSEAGKKAGLTAKYTEFAAQHFLRLKRSANPEGWLIIEPRFQELHSAEAPLREVYDPLDKAK